MNQYSSSYQENLFYGASQLIIERAGALRKNMTPAEMRLWKFLKNKQILKLRFRRQHPIDIFIADFYCHQIILVVELDGEIHNNNETHEYDENRTSELERLGITVIRFKNHEVMENLEEVIFKLKEICTNLLR
ncbi:endonuclease domain-containing protein [Marinilabilia salmonicolor]|uniref:Very-short-patch-repair endonuclease n=1 Tax=Marinilabilia salmonicolor TaxID=989 RepID=A0A368UKM8_9BACT|nr:endonuclease domain-containing protein [Marinilabilia salmonicolor]RCW27036.1 very-short-patch-repair endonuclease [Marinilabilia salmonicolor]